MSEHAIALIALAVSILGTIGNGIAFIIGLRRHCRNDDEARGAMRAELELLKRQEWQR